MPDATAHPPGSAADQLATLVSLGVRLRPDVDPAEALAPLGPYQLKMQPYVAVLSRLAQQPGFDEVIEPGAPAINVGALDTEFVEDTDAYENPIRFLAAACGRSDRISDIASNIDVEAEEGTVSYRIDGQLQTWNVEVKATGRTGWCSPTSSTTCSIRGRMSSSSPRTRSSASS